MLPSRISDPGTKGRPMNEKIAPLIHRVKNFLLAQYGDKVRQVSLYGSHARGTATEDSDIDLLVLVDKELSAWKVQDSLSDLLWDIILETNEIISVVVLTEDVFSSIITSSW
ncbi:MAG: nucleotidyltransferase domain-containing protein [Thermoguttaceae bacterium]|nr:nucleotidyltransferase domain-containing protein [Thermoguttaceae bacterium]MDW8036467.1 nucleotidyltransferase domain-containing protein [Thermoguttaceae bacterium]